MINSERKVCREEEEWEEWTLKISSLNSSVEEEDSSVEEDQVDEAEDLKDLEKEKTSYTESRFPSKISTRAKLRNSLYRSTSSVGNARVKVERKVRSRLVDLVKVRESRSFFVNSVLWFNKFNNPVTIVTERERSSTRRIDARTATERRLSTSERFSRFTSTEE